MDNLGLDKYLNMVNEEKKERGLKNYIPLYPMLRVENDVLYVGVLITDEKDNVWDKDAKIKPEYWVLIDINSNSIKEFNETDKKDFVIGKLIEKHTENKQKELSEYTVKKALQYKEYFMEDIKNDQLPFQKKLASILNNEIEVDGTKVNINDYLISHIEEELKEKIDELVELLVYSKYGSITFYYCNLFKQIVDSYKQNHTIDKDKMKLCCEIMNNYYDGVIGIDNFFNI